jgi:hypothetical protein
MKTYTVAERYNRLVSDIRCVIGGTLIRLGACITDAAVHSSRGKHHTWKWQSLTKSVRP